MAAPLPMHLLELARHKGSPVRQALVELLNTKPHQEHLAALLILAKDEWSPRSSSYGEEDDYPITQAAMTAIGKLAMLEDGVADDLYRVAVDTRNSDVRYKIFVLLVRAADPRFQGQLFELAINPGRRPVRQVAAAALLAGHPHVASEIVGRTAPLLETRIEASHLVLLILVALRGEIDDVVRGRRGARDERQASRTIAPGDLGPCRPRSARGGADRLDAAGKPRWSKMGSPAPKESSATRRWMILETRQALSRSFSSCARSE